MRNLCTLAMGLLLLATLGACAPSGGDAQGVVSQQGPRGFAGAQGEAGATGARGPKGAVGAAGPAGSGAGIVHFSMNLSNAPTHDFAFFPANNGDSSPATFNTTRTDASNTYYSSFLVPSDGTISDLTIRLDLSSIATISPNFTFTVYQSAAAVGASAPMAGWVSTGLAQSTGALAISSSSSITAVFQETSTTVPVTAGTILAVVISGTGFSSFDIQPCAFSTSFKYTPN